MFTPALLRGASSATRSVAVRNMGTGPTHCFDGKPFRKSTTAAYLFVIVGGGIGTIMFAVTFQQKKHGFW